MPGVGRQFTSEYSDGSCMVQVSLTHWTMTHQAQLACSTHFFIKRQLQHTMQAQGPALNVPWRANMNWQPRLCTPASSTPKPGHTGQNQSGPWHEQSRFIGGPAYVIQARGRHLAPAQLTRDQHAATKLHAGICRAHVLSAAWCRWPTLATPQVRPQPTGAQLCWHTPEASMLLPESACQTVPLPPNPIPTTAAYG